MWPNECLAEVFVTVFYIKNFSKISANLSVEVAQSEIVNNWLLPIVSGQIELTLNPSENFC